MLIIAERDKRIDDIREIDRIAKESGTKAYILGAGVYARALATYLKNNGLSSTIGFVVDDQYIDSINQSDQKVISLSDYIRMYSKKAPLIFGIYNYEFVIEKRLQFEGEINYMFDFHITAILDRIVDWNRDYVIDNRSKFEDTYELLSNENSKKTMQYYLDAAIGGKFDKLFRECRETSMYFDGKIKEYSLDKIFDCGAFDGDSIHDFIAAYPDYKKLYAFEPDKANIDKIKERIKREGIHDLQIIDKGVWSETTTLHFESDGTSMSSISDEGAQTIEVIKLDDMCDCFDSKSLIKMDIEGSELEALKGAEKIIKEIKPALAICVYHRREDLITIPQYIDSLAPQGTYDYYLGYQGLDLAELVFYAVPKK